MTSKETIRVADIDKQAVAWHNLLQSGEPSEDQLLAYVDWLKASPDHEAAIAECETAWDLLLDLEKDSEVANLQANRRQRPRPGLARRYRWFAATAALVLVSAGMFFYRSLFEIEQKYSAWRYVTALGEQEVHRLEDDTRIMLNTSTEIEVLYNDDERVITLQRGEALFDVAPDIRPFRVVTEFGETRALGTLFNVHIRANRVDVSLLEGEVAVQANGGSAFGDWNKQLHLKPGQQISYSADGKLSPVVVINNNGVLLWTKRKLDFRQTRLQDAVQEINRYSARKFVIKDPEINDTEITLRISIDNIESFLDVSEELFGIRPEYQFGKVYLSRALKTSE